MERCASFAHSRIYRVGLEGKTLKQKRLFALLLALLLGLGIFCGCGTQAAPDAAALPEPAASVQTATPSAAPPPDGTPEPETSAPVSQPDITPVPDPTPEAPAIAEDGEYTDPHSVALYLRAYGHLPDNFITKREARDLGWPGGDLWRYAPGKSIGGDRFGNYEGLLPEGTAYRECDVNYAGGPRGPERLVYGENGAIYYTKDHYTSFVPLSGEGAGA